MMHVIVTWFVTSDPQPQALAVDAEVLGLDIPPFVAEWRDHVRDHLGEPTQILVSTRRKHGMKPATYNDFFGSLPQEAAELVEALITESESAAAAAAEAELTS